MQQAELAGLTGLAGAGQGLPPQYCGRLLSPGLQEASVVQIGNRSVTRWGVESGSYYDSTGLRVLLLGHHTYIPGHVGTRAPGGLGIRVGVQSNPSLTMPPLGRGIRRGGHHLPVCISGIARVPNTGCKALYMVKIDS